MHKVLYGLILTLILVSPAWSGNPFVEGGKEVGQGAKKLGKETGKAFKEGGKEVGQSFHKAGKETGREAGKAGRSMGEAFRRMGQGIRKFFKGE